MARMPNRADLEAALDAAVEIGKAQAKALAALPGAITAIAEAAQNINATANEARAVIRKAQAVTDRLDSMLDHVEPAVSEITPTLQALKEAQQRIVAMTGSTEKMASFVEDAGAGLSKLAGISGATGLFNRLAAAAKPVEPTPRSLGAVRPELAANDEHVEEFLAELVETPVPPSHVEEGIEDADIVQPEATEATEATEEPSPTVASTSDPDAEVASDQPHQVAEAQVDAAFAPDEAHQVAEAQVDAAFAPDEAHQVTEAQVDAALEPVELGSEADGPDEADDKEVDKAVEEDKDAPPS